MAAARNAQYAPYAGWMLCPDFYELMPHDSIIPKTIITPGTGWKTIDLNRKEKDGTIRDPFVQGWKIHVNVAPPHIVPLAKLICPVLQSMGVSHKFADPRQYRERPDRYDGKAFTIYPKDPNDLVRVAKGLRDVFHANQNGDRNNRLIPYTSPAGVGVPGDLKLFRNGGFISCRYGSFTRGDDIWNPIRKCRVPDRRDRPFPPFIKRPPKEIRSIQA